MGKLKTRKAVLKRIKITGKNKLLRRKLHQSHFNAKESGNVTRRKRKKSGFAPVDSKKIKKILPTI